MKTSQLVGIKSCQVARFLSSLKDAPNKCFSLGAIKKVASLNPWRQNAKWRNPPTDSTVPNQNMSESKYSCTQEPVNRGKYVYIDLSLRYALGKSSCVFKIPPVQQFLLRIIVSVFLSTLQLSALLLKRFRLRLHCYTLPNVCV